MSGPTVVIEHILPHRHPFLLIDQVKKLEPGVSGESLKTFPLDDPIFNGCSKEYAGVPTGILIECLAQCSAIVAFGGLWQNMIDDNDKDSPRLGVLCAIHEFEYHSLVPPGSTAIIRITITHRFGEMIRSRGEIFIGESLCACGELSFKLLPRDIMRI